MRRAALPLLLVALALPVSRAGARPSGPGCDPSRPAVAHHADGAVLEPQPLGRPIPCGVNTGYGGAENRIRVTPTGAVVYTPAVITPGLLGNGYVHGAPGPHPQIPTSPGGLTISRDGGATWDFVRPLDMTYQPQDHQLYVDNDTGRIFWYVMNANPFPQGGGISVADQPPGPQNHMLMSADDGRTWSRTSTCCPFFSENPRFASAPAPTGAPQPVNYPNVVYFCANTTVGFTSPIIAGRVCSRSLNGGVTWTQASILFTGLIPQHPECGLQGEQYSAGDGNYPQAALDGSLYIMVTCGGTTYLARSTDEASTWPIVRVLPHGGELRLDTAGNLYLFRKAGFLYVSVSTDEGATWSEERNLVAPGVNGVGTWFPAVREPGHIAVAYYGQLAERTSSDGYITESRNALDDDPVFWSGDVGSLLTDGQGSRFPGPGFLDYNGADIGPDGTAWGSFVQDCPADATDPACTDASGKKMWGARAFAGHLEWPAPA
jgi:hypothetical protein